MTLTMDLVENTISIIRFSVTGSSNQLFNYIPLLKGSFTKVNVNYVIHVNDLEKQRDLKPLSISIIS